MCHWGHPFLLLLLSFEDVALVQFVYLVFTHMPAGLTVGDSGLCGCVPCLSSAIISFSWVIQIVYMLGVHQSKIY